MKNISLLSALLMLFGSMTAMTSCYSNLELHERSFASKMHKYVEDTSSLVKTGGIRLIPISTPKGSLKVWTKTIGHSDRIKVLLLGSGPDLSHEYLQCMESYFPGKAISFIYYDPLGSGRSENLKDTALYSLARGTDEIEQLRLALNLNQDNFYLFGHGRGGMLAIEYALKYQNNLKALILSNTVSSSKIFANYTMQLISAQPATQTIKQVSQKESGPNIENSQDKMRLTEFYSKHVCRLPPGQYPAVFESFFKVQSDSIHTFNSASDAFTPPAEPSNWDRSADLKKITVPTLLIGAKYDLMDPEHVKWMASQVKNGTYLYCANGSHLSMYDDQQVYMNGITDFIYKVYREDHFWDIYF
jgi:proline iminopeptidase